MALLVFDSRLSIKGLQTLLSVFVVARIAYNGGANAFMEPYGCLHAASMVLQVAAWVFFTKALPKDDPLAAMSTLVWWTAVWCKAAQGEVYTWMQCLRLIVVLWNICTSLRDLIQALLLFVLCGGGGAPLAERKPIIEITLKKNDNNNKHVVEIDEKKNV